REGGRRRTSSEVAAQGQRADLGSVRGRHGSEDAPGDAAEKLADKQHGQAGSKKCDEDKGGNEDKRGEEDLAITKLVREVAVGEGTDNSADADGIGQAVLP